MPVVRLQVFWRVLAACLGLAVVVSLLAALVASRPRGDRAQAGPRLVVVAMWDRAGVYRFAPSEIHVRRGDRVRFVLDGRAAHNVEFPGMSIGPYVTRRDQAYDVVVDDRFADGVHPFHCPPHAPLGMRGRLVVEGDARPSHSR